MNSSKQEEWQVEKILQRGRFKNVTHYLILWKGYSSEQATWEPVTNLQHCRQAIMEFQMSLKQNNKPQENKKEGRRRMNFRKVFEEKPTSQRSNVKKEVIPEPNKQLGFLSVQLKNSQQALNKKKQMSQSIKQSKEIIPRKEVQHSKSNKSRRGEHSLSLERREEAIKRQRGLQESEDKANASKKIKQNEKSLESKVPQPIIQNNKMLEDLSQLTNPQKQLKDPIIHSKGQDEKTPPNKRLINQKCSIKSQQQTSTHPKQPPKQTAPQYSRQLFTPSLDGCRLLGYTLPNYQIKRYQFCDLQYKKRQKETLNNMIRKVNGQTRVKSKINMIDISRNPQYLQELDGIEKANTNVGFQSIDLFIKLDYGWVIVGKTSQKKFLMSDVNYIKQQNWKALQKKLKETSSF